LWKVFSSALRRSNTKLRRASDPNQGHLPKDVRWRAGRLTWWWLTWTPGQRRLTGTPRGWLTSRRRLSRKGALHEAALSWRWLTWRRLTRKGALHEAALSRRLTGPPRRLTLSSLAQAISWLRGAICGAAWMTACQCRRPDGRCDWTCAASTSYPSSQPCNVNVPP